MVRVVCLVALLLASPHARAGDASLPPGERPVPVTAGFFLVNLSDVAERAETFDADLYLSLRWHDARLASARTEPERFLDDAAEARLDAMWWPQLEFVNTAEPTITNRSLEIRPDGTVSYVIGLTAEFRADFDLRRFPLDHQRLEVQIESFTWTAEQMVFVADPTRVGFNPDSTFEGLAVTGVRTQVRERDIAGWGERFSEFVPTIEVDRRAAFYVWTVFAPIGLIFLISCTVFVVDVSQFQDRVAISLAALLACIATQFAISFSLPQISYLTIIDRIFLTTYFCVAIGVLVSTLQAVMLRGDRRTVVAVDHWAGLGLPLLYALLIVTCVAC